MTTPVTDPPTEISLTVREIPLGDPVIDIGGTQPYTPAQAEEPVAPAGYEILGELGRGGMGVVYKARQIAANRVVALKMILSGGHAGERERARFQTEAEAIARLQHPHIVQIYEVGENEGIPFFSLEFCPRGSLEKMLAGTPIPANDAAVVVEKLARGMEAAHQKGVIHRDLKPANVLLADDGTPKITDFGLAKKLDEAVQTQSGAVMGTPSYMAPEQAAGRGNELGPACDIYALGAILYECLTGRPPFKAATGMETLLQVVRDEPVPPRQLQSNTPLDLETICLKCLRKEPARRYVSAAALADDLERWREGKPIEARPVGNVERVVKWARREPTIAALWAIIIVLSLAGVASLLVGNATTLLAAIALVWVWTLFLFLKRQSRLRDIEDRPEWDKRAPLERIEPFFAAIRTAKRRVQLWVVICSVALLGALLIVKRLSTESSGFLPFVVALAFILIVPLIIATSRAWRQYSRALRDVALASSPSPEPVKTRNIEAGTTRGGRSYPHFDFREKVILGTLVGACYLPLLLGVATHAWAGLPDGAIAAAIVVGAVTGAICGGMSAAFRGRTFGAIFTLGLGQSLSGVARQSGTDWLLLREAGFWFATLPGLVGLAALVFGSLLAWRAGPREKGSSVAGRLFLVARITAFIGLLVCTGVFGGELGLLLGGNSGRIIGELSGGFLGILCGFALTEALKSRHYSPDPHPLWELAMVRQRWLRLTLLAVLGVMVLTPNWLEWRDGTPGVRLDRFPHRTAVTAVAFSAEGVPLSGDLNRRIRFGLREVDTLESARKAFPPLAVQEKPNAQQLKDQLEFLDRRLARGDSVVSLIVLPDGKRALSAIQDGSLILWDVNTGRLLRPIPGPRGVIGCAAFAPDGRTVVTGTAWPNFIHLPQLFSRDLPPGASPETPVSDELKESVARLWDTETGQQVQIFKGHRGEVRAVTFAPDGRQLLTASDDGTMRLWDVVTGLQVRRLKGYSSRVLAVAISSDGRQALSGHEDGTVRLWDLEDEEEIRRLERHRAGVVGVAFVPDGRTAFSASLDGTVRCWDTTTGRQLGVSRKTTPLYSMAVSQDGLSVLTGNAGGIAQRWYWPRPEGR